MQDSETINKSYNFGEGQVLYGWSCLWEMDLKLNPKGWI